MELCITEASIQEAFREWYRKVEFHSNPYFFRRAEEYAFLCMCMKKNKTLTFRVLLEEIDLHPWLAFMIIGPMLRHAYDIPPHEIGRVDQLMLRLYRWAIGRGYGSPKIREACEELRAKVRADRKKRRMLRKANHP